MDWNNFRVQRNSGEIEGDLILPGILRSILLSNLFGVLVYRCPGECEIYDILDFILAIFPMVLSGKIGRDGASRRVEARSDVAETCV